MNTCQTCGVEIDPHKMGDCDDCSDIKRIANRKEIDKLHPGNRFRLMAGLPLLPEDQQEHKMTLAECEKAIAETEAYIQTMQHRRDVSARALIRGVGSEIGTIQMDAEMDIHIKQATKTLTGLFEERELLSLVSLAEPSVLSSVCSSGDDSGGAVAQ